MAPNRPCRSRQLGTRPLLRDEALRVAILARVHNNERGPFCDAICAGVKTIWDQDRRAVSSKPGRKAAGAAPRRAVSSKPGPALIKAAGAARALNEAVCTLSKQDRKWVDGIAARHPWLSNEERLLPSTDLFELDELHRTTWQLAFLLNTAIGRPSPVLAGTTVAG